MTSRSLEKVAAFLSSFQFKNVTRDDFKILKFTWVFKKIVSVKLNIFFIDVSLAAMQSFVRFYILPVENLNIIIIIIIVVVVIVLISPGKR